MFIKWAAGSDNALHARVNSCYTEARPSTFTSTLWPLSTDFAFICFDLWGPSVRKWPRSRDPTAQVSSYRRERLEPALPRSAPPPQTSRRNWFGLNCTSSLFSFVLPPLFSLSLGKRGQVRARSHAASVSLLPFHPFLHRNWQFDKTTNK